MRFNPSSRLATFTVFPITEAVAEEFRSVQPKVRVTVEIEVRGSEVIRHIIDGEVVLEYTEPQLDKADKLASDLLPGRDSLLLESGTISLQSESHPVQFRKVELLPLDE